ncbi:hypothetical protein CLU79DRAFT_421700 [Phycomyces nitens]|nr:hypothetical protein CLU79DRAFT_421700 [Phycomyces nitens]
MSHHADKPSLPSIQFLLQEADPLITPDNSRRPPQPLPTTPSTSAVGAGLGPGPTIDGSHAMNLLLETVRPRPVRAGLGHRSSRSVSSLPIDLQSLSLYAPTMSKDDMSVPSETKMSWTPLGHHRASHNRTHSDTSHRRTASASTVDFMLNPAITVETSSVQSSPSSPPLQEVYETDGQRDLQAGRYVCMFCGKKFSRPSSLRIHTYSHTGEKPFVCTEENCGRRFSVQSNMRRHMRVHRFGRPKPALAFDPSE